MNLSILFLLSTFFQENIDLGNIVKFHLKNVSDVRGDILAGAFNKSSSTLKEFKIDISSKKSNRVVKTGAFSNLSVLETIDLGLYWQHFKIFFNDYEFNHKIVNML